MPGGRPTSFTLPRAKQIAELVRTGSDRRNASRLLGLQYRTVQNWYNRGKRGEAPFVEFFHLLRAADAEWERRLLQRVDGGDHWQGAAWRLERDPRTRDRWGARSRFDDADRQAVIDLSDVSDEDLEEAERLLRGKKSA